MWAVSPSSPPKLFFQFLIQKPTFNPRSNRLRSQPPRENAGDTIEPDGTSVKALGITILEAIQSSDPKSTNPNLTRRNRKQQDKENEGKQRKGEEEAEELQISGSDVLWALKKAATQRAKQQQKTKKKKRGVSSSESVGTEDGDDIENFSPLRIKSDWGMRLNELEKRLQEISETI